MVKRRANKRDDSHAARSGRTERRRGSRGGLSVRIAAIGGEARGSAHATLCRLAGKCQSGSHASKKRVTHYPMRYSIS